VLANGVLIQQFGASWTAAKCLIAMGVVLMILTAVLFRVLFKHRKGTVRRLDPYEAGRVALHGRSTATPGVDEVIQGKGVGVGIEMKFGIDDLRLAARRGDWKTFWLWPVIMTCAILAFLCIFTGVLLAAAAPGVLHIPLDLMVLFVLFMTWFSSWAATHTNIDASTASPRNPPAIPPGRGAAGPVNDVGNVDEQR